MASPAPALTPLCLMQVAEGLTGKTSTGEDLRVREVWQDNLDSELEIIRDIVDDYPYIAMDTEFPGVVARPVGNFKNSGEYHFQTLRWEPQHTISHPSLTQQPLVPRQLHQSSCLHRCNVDMLKLIQLGLTFSDAEGRLPRCNGELCVWQFNFRCASWMLCFTCSSPVQPLSISRRQQLLIQERSHVPLLSLYIVSARSRDSA